jgi:hypothetical protein
VDHVPPVAPPPTVPPKLAVALAQIVWLAPTDTIVAALLTVTTTFAVAAPHGEVWPVVLSVSVTTPALISDADGV